MITYKFTAIDHIGRKHTVTVQHHTYLEAKDVVLASGYYQAFLYRTGDEVSALMQEAAGKR